MRSSNEGGLPKIPAMVLKPGKRRPDTSKGRTLKTAITQDLSGAITEECRTNKYAVPKHRARRSTEDSVSFPVWKELSQRSSVSETPQIKNVSRTAETAILEILDRIVRNHATGGKQDDAREDLRNMLCRSMCLSVRYTLG